MEKAIKILAVYAILVSLYSVVTRFLSLGMKFSINVQTATASAILVTPVIILAVLVFFYLKKRSKI
jgi:hypothetical protein